MAVVRRGGQKEPMLETIGEPSDRAGELAVDGVPRPARRRSVVRLVEDDQRARPEFAEQVAQTADIGLVGKERVRNDEARSRGPRTGAIPSLPPQDCEILAVDDGEGEAELDLQF